MIIKTIGTSGGKTNGSKLTTFVVNNTLSIDAGSICSGMTIEQQLNIADIIISHAHLDHIAELPFFLDNIAIAKQHVNIHCTEETLISLKKYVFNNQVWPDFAKIPSEKNPTVTYKIHKYNNNYEIGKLTFTFIPVNHMEGSAGIIVESKNTAFAFTSDTGKTNTIWEKINANPKCNTIITECSFPKRLRQLAEISHHLDVSQLEEQLKKLQPQKNVFIYHLKPQLKREIAKELENLNVTVLSDGDALEV